VTDPPAQPLLPGLVNRPAHQTAPGQLRIMTWNVQHANAARSRRQADWIAQQPVDTVVLTEVAASNGAAALIEELTSHGFTVTSPAGPGTDYRVLVGSRVGELQPWPTATVSHLPHRCVAVRLHLSDRHPLGATIGIVGLYVPSRGNRQRRNVDKRAFQATVAELLPRLPELLAVDGPIVVTGDLNVVEPGHQPAHKVFGTWEYEFYRAFDNAGLTDTFRHLHPHRTDHSWYGRSGTGYRFDHAFCSATDVVVSCHYSHEPRLIPLSDHAAMGLVLGKAPSA
jgi:exodeoxyribonuclease III